MRGPGAGVRARLPLLAVPRLPLELVAQDLVGDGGGLELLPGRVGADALRLRGHADGPRQRRALRLALLLPRLRRRPLLECPGRLVGHGERVVPPLLARLLVLLVRRPERRLELLPLLGALRRELVERRRQHLDLLALGGVGGAERLTLRPDVVVLRAVLLRVLLRVDDRRLQALDRADQLAVHRLLLLDGLAGLKHDLLEHGAPLLRRARRLSGRDRRLLGNGRHRAEIELGRRVILVLGGARLAARRVHPERSESGPLLPPRGRRGAHVVLKRNHGEHAIQSLSVRSGSKERGRRRGKFSGHTPRIQHLGVPTSGIATCQHRFLAAALFEMRDTRSCVGAVRSSPQVARSALTTLRAARLPRSECSNTLAPYNPCSPKVQSETDPHVRMHELRIGAPRGRAWRCHARE